MCMNYTVQIVQRTSTIVHVLVYELFLDSTSYFVAQAAIKHDKNYSSHEPNMNIHSKNHLLPS
jgi:hypothetical protein